MKSDLKSDKKSDIKSDRNSTRHRTRNRTENRTRNWTKNGQEIGHEIGQNIGQEIGHGIGQEIGHEIGQKTDSKSDIISDKKSNKTLDKKSDKKERVAPFHCFYIVLRIRRSRKLVYLYEQNFLLKRVRINLAHNTFVRLNFLIPFSDAGVIFKRHPSLLILCKGDRIPVRNLGKFSLKFSESWALESRIHSSRSKTVLDSLYTYGEATMWGQVLPEVGTNVCCPWMNLKDIIAAHEHDDKQSATCPGMLTRNAPIILKCRVN